MVERKEAVTMHGKPLTLMGNVLRVGEKAPDFEAVDTDLKSVRLSENRGKVVLLAAVPSLDTAVCSRESKRFNDEVGKLGPQVSCFVVSMDLPFAQKRWCGSEGAAHVRTLSDYKRCDFGEKYGVLIKELRLLARSVFLVDQDGVLRYQLVCKEVTQEPPYEQVIKELTALLSSAAP